MLRVQEGEAAAFTELVLRYQNRLITILDHLVGNRQTAEDLAQDVFVRVFKARERYQPGAKFSTWLFTIANHVASNALRSQSRRPEINLDARESGPLGANPMENLAIEKSGQMPTRQLDSVELKSAVHVALQSLSERQRMAVLLSKFEEMSYADIAETMQLSQPAVKSLLSRARLNLKSALEPYWQNGEITAAKANGTVGDDDL
jgi:RNA polymerase sigma-70 factor (ECF subfamily)